MDVHRRRRLVFYTAALLGMTSAWILYVGSIVLADTPWIIAPALVVQTGLALFASGNRLPDASDPEARMGELVFITTNLFSFFIVAMSGLDAGRRHQLGASPVPGLLILACNLILWVSGLLGFYAGQPVHVDVAQQLEDRKAERELRRERARERALRLAAERIDAEHAAADRAEAAPRRDGAFSDASPGP